MPSKSIVIVLIYLSALQNSAIERQDIIDLHKRIFANYTQSHVTSAPSYPTIVNVTLSITAIYGLSESEVMELGCFFSIFWRDPSLVWNPDKWNDIRNLQIDSGKVWVPDVGLWDSKQPKQSDFILLEARRLSLKHTGLLTLPVWAVVKFSCPIDATYFPFDIQYCRMTLGTTVSSNTTVQLVMPSHSVMFETLAERVTGEWSPVNITLRKRSYSDPRTLLVYDSYQIYIWLERRSTYYVLIVIIPFCLLSLVSGTMFLVEDANDRISVSLSVLMGMTLYILITSQSSPKSMVSVSLLGFFLISQMGTVILFTFVTITIATHKPSETNELSRVEGCRISKSDGFFLMLYIFITLANAVICLVILPRHLGHSITYTVD